MFLSSSPAGGIGEEIDVGFFEILYSWRVRDILIETWIEYAVTAIS
jgi:hypothetical protein